MSVNPEALAELYRTAELSAHDLKLGDRVEVELLVSTTVTGAAPGIIVPRIVEGTVVAGTPRALVLDTGRTRSRIPWPAVALIRDAVTAHPATS